VSWYGINRTWCDCVEHVRKLCDHTTQFTWESNRDMIRSLCEELQVYGDRMEAGLGDLTDLESLHENIKEKKKELEELKKQIKKRKDKPKEPPTVEQDMKELLDD